jgi:hypothetical protein
MPIQYVNTGTSANAGNGDSIRLAFTKINRNFQELDNSIGNLAEGGFQTLSVSNTLTTKNLISTGTAILNVVQAAGFQGITNFESITVANDSDLNHVTANDITVASTVTVDTLNVGTTISLGNYQVAQINEFNDFSIIKNDANGLSVILLNTNAESNSKLIVQDNIGGGLALVHDNSTDLTGIYNPGENYIYGITPTDVLNIGAYSDIKFSASQARYYNPALANTSSMVINSLDGSIDIFTTATFHGHVFGIAGGGGGSGNGYALTSGTTATIVLRADGLLIPTYQYANARIGYAKTLRLGESGYQTVITTAPPTVAHPEADRIIIAGQDGLTNNEGGDVYLWAGRSGPAGGTKGGGDIIVEGGDGYSASPGGNINIQGGNSNGGSGGFGGTIRVEAGSSFSAGGQGGDVLIKAGHPENGGTYGLVQISVGETNTSTFRSDGISLSTVAGVNWEFDTYGILTMPGGATLQNGFAGASPGAAAGVSNNSGNQQFFVQDDGAYVQTSANNSGTSFNSWVFGTDGILHLPQGGAIAEGGGISGAIRLKPAGGANANQALLIYPTAADGDHIHLTAGGGTTDLYLGDDLQFVKVEHGGNIKIQAHTAVTAVVPASSTWYNIFGELIGSTASNWTSEGSVTYDTAGNVFVLGSTTDSNDFNNSTNLFVKYSPLGELIWRKTWTTPVGSNCGSYNASLRFQAATTGTVDAIVWASNSDPSGTTTSTAYIGTMDLDGNLVDNYGGVRAPHAITNYRITDIHAFGQGTTYISGAYSNAIGTYASIAKVNFTNTDSIHYIFAPNDQQSGFLTNALFKSIQHANIGASQLILAVGSYYTTAGPSRAIVGIVSPFGSTHDLFTIGNGTYSNYSLYFEHQAIDIDSVLGLQYGMINNDNYDHSTSIQTGPAYTVISNSFGGGGPDSWQKKISIANCALWGYALAYHNGYVYASCSVRTANSSDTNFVILKLNKDTGALVWARTIGSPLYDGYPDEGYGAASSSGLSIDPTGTYLAFTNYTSDLSTGTVAFNNFTIQYPLDGSLLGMYNDFVISDTADLTVTDHDYTFLNVTADTVVTVSTLAISTATLTATATAANSSTWTNFYWPLDGGTGGYVNTINTSSTAAWQFAADGKLTLPGGLPGTTSIINSGGFGSIGADGSSSIAWTDSDSNPTQISAITADGNTGVVIQAGAVAGGPPVPDYQWTFGTDGTLTLPAGGNINSTDGITLVTDRGTLAIGTQLEVPGVAGHLHIAFNNSNVNPPASDLFLGDDYNYVKLPGYELNTVDYGVEIGTHNREGGSNHAWRFGTDGDLTLPGQLLFPEGTTFYNNGISVSSGTQYATGVQGNTAGINQYWFADGTMPTRKWAAVRVNSPENASTGSVVLSTGAFNSRNNWIFAHDGSTVLPENTLKGYCFTATNAVVNYIPQAGSFYYTDNPILRSIATIGGAWYIKGPGLVGWKQITGVQDNSGVALIVRIGSGGGPMLDGSEFHSGGYQPNSPDLVYTISQYLELDVKAADKTWKFKQDGSIVLPYGSTITDQNNTGTVLTVANPPSTITISGADFSSVNQTYTQNPNDLTSWIPANYNNSSDPYIQYLNGQWGIYVPGFGQSLYINNGTLLNPLTQWSTHPPLGSVAPTAVYTYTNPNWTFGSTGTLILPSGGDIVRDGVSVLGGGGGGGPVFRLTSSTAVVSLAANGTLTFPNNDLTISSISSPAPESRIWTTNSDITMYRNGRDGYGVKESEVIVFAGNGQIARFVPTGLEIASGKSLKFPDATVQTTAYTGTVAYSNITGAPASVNKTSGSWILNPGANTVSITVAPGGSYQMWVNGNISNGIVLWNATVSTSNPNVPVIGSQYGWYYAVGNQLVLTSMPNQIVGTAGSISTAVVTTTTSNVFKFGITNNSVSTQTVYWGYTTL